MFGIELPFDYFSARNSEDFFYKATAVRVTGLDYDPVMNMPYVSDKIKSWLVNNNINIQLYLKTKNNKLNGIIAFTNSNDAALFKLRW